MKSISKVAGAVAVCSAIIAGAQFVVAETINQNDFEWKEAPNHVSKNVAL